MKNLIKYSLTLLMVLLISGCGGGGGGDGSANTDNTAPVITLNGDNPLTLILNDSYVEAGASVFDDVDGSVAVVISGTVDTNTIGSYTVTYTATNAAGNTGTATRTVNVVDGTPPVITLNGNNPLSVKQNNTYTEAGASAFDDVDGSVAVVISSSVDTSTIASYTVTYTANDAAGNIGMATRTVNVVDGSPPVITLNGENPLRLLQNDPYTEAGASAFDNVDGIVAVDISGSVDTSTIDSYTVIYTATDAARNTGTVLRTVNVVLQKPFVTTWKTDNIGFTADNQIQIGTIGSGNNYNVDWGDSQTDVNVAGDITHTYSTPGTYTVSIRGEFPAIYFQANGYDNNKLLSIEQWGDIKWRSMRYAFYNCVNLVGNASDVPDLSLVYSMTYMFSGASIFNQNLSSWDVSSVISMNNMFSGATAFNQPLNDWNVAGVTDMSSMFQIASAYSQDLSGWDVSSVENMDGMFQYASAFNQDLGSWDVSSVETMHSMFRYASAFNQNIGGWDVTSVTDMTDMFTGLTLSVFNYDALLLGWSAKTLQNGVTFSAGASQYSSRIQTLLARKKLIDTYGWNVLDGGVVP